MSRTIPIKLSSSGAEFSSDRKYRYALWRIWDDRPLVMVIGLNPSTANESKNDPTIEKVIKVASRNGFGGVYMMNLFGIVSKDPEILKSDSNPIGDNDKFLEEISAVCEKVVFAWGNFKEARERALQVVANFNEALCFKQNKNGSPKHPLYCLDETILIPFDSTLLL